MFSSPDFLGLMLYVHGAVLYWSLQVCNVLNHVVPDFQAHLFTPPKSFQLLVLLRHHTHLRINLTVSIKYSSGILMDVVSVPQSTWQRTKY